jgi:hypothetical protein
MVDFYRVILLGTIFGVDGRRTSQRGTFVGVDVGKKMLVH